jgi:redox-sensitive bicupin YhaK (pirin superfamily)
VNLPARDKMIKPRYQDVPPESIPSASIPGAKHPKSQVRVVAGESCGVKAVIDTHTPINYLDIQLHAGDKLEQYIPATHVGFVYVYRGAGFVGANRKPAQESQMVELGTIDNNVNSTQTH